MLEGRARQLEQQRPLVQALGEFTKRDRFRGRVVELSRQHPHRLRYCHLVHVEPDGLGGNVKDACGDQTHAILPAPHEWPEVRRVPNVVDHNQAVLVLKFLCQMKCSVFPINKAGALPRQRGVKLG